MKNVQLSTVEKLGNLIVCYIFCKPIMVRGSIEIENNFVKTFFFGYL